MSSFLDVAFGTSESRL